jgi:hypothetical protein
LGLVSLPFPSGLVLKFQVDLLSPSCISYIWPSCLAWFDNQMSYDDLYMWEGSNFSFRFIQCIIWEINICVSRIIALNLVGKNRNRYLIYNIILKGQFVSVINWLSKTRSWRMWKWTYCSVILDLAASRR